MADVTARGGPLLTPPTLVASGASVSNAFQTFGAMFGGVDLGATLTSAVIYPFNSVDGINFYPTVDGAGATVTWTVAGGQYLKFDPPKLGYGPWVKFVTGSNEAAARTITPVLVP